MKAARFVLAFGFALATQAMAADIIVIDSGVDYKHKDLASKMWVNPGEIAGNSVDDEKNGYVDDVYGWNLADGNNQVIDYKYLGTFSQDCYKLFDVQSKILLGTATQADVDWYKAKVQDAEFIKELNKFGNFVHGTHVSGISSKDNNYSKIVALKIIPTEVPGARIARAARWTDRYFRDAMDDLKMQMALGFVASNNAKTLTTAGQYAKLSGAKVGNGSFGTSVKAVEPTVKGLAQQLLSREPTDAEVRTWSIYLVQQLITKCKAMVDASPDTLFVFAAGNDGTNNDDLPTSPANIKTDNTIAVAATVGIQKIASFSNYGVKNVDVAAPGTAIMSTIPGDEYLGMSGTSMACPFVTNVAGQVRSINPALTTVQTKRVLMETVDAKDYLKTKVKSGGIVNPARAYRAAELSKSMDLTAAIQAARGQIPDVVVSRTFLGDDTNLFVLPLPSLL